MRSLISLVTFVTFLSLFTHNLPQAAAVPFDLERAHLVKRAPPYPGDAAINAALTDFDGPAVFFSNLAPKTKEERDAPDTFAKSVNGRTVKRAFGDQPVPNSRKLFTDRWPGQGSKDNYQDFADRFSRIFAEKASGDTAFVLLRSLDGPTGPKALSVWNVHELPALKKNPNIKKIVRVNPEDFDDQQQIFPEVQAATPAADAAAAPDAAAPQLESRRLGGARLGGGGLGGGLFGGGQKTKPTKTAQEAEGSASSKEKETAPASSKPTTEASVKATTTPSAKATTTLSIKSTPASSSLTSTATSTASARTSTSQSTAASTSGQGTSTSAVTSTSTTTSTVTSSAQTSSTSASSRTTSSTTSSRTARPSVVLDWDNPKDGPYYSAILL